MFVLVDDVPRAPRHEHLCRDAVVFEYCDDVPNPENVLPRRRLEPAHGLRLGVPPPRPGESPGHWQFAAEPPEQFFESIFFLACENTPALESGRSVKNALLDLGILVAHVNHKADKHKAPHCPRRPSFITRRPGIKGQYYAGGASEMQSQKPQTATRRSTHSRLTPPASPQS